MNIESKAVIKKAIDDLTVINYKCNSILEKGMISVPNRGLKLLEQIVSTNVELIESLQYLSRNDGHTELVQDVFGMARNSIELLEQVLMFFESIEPSNLTEFLNSILWTEPY